MSVLLMTTPKVLLTTPREEWARSVGARAVLFTGGDSEEQIKKLQAHLVGIFAEIHFFKNYEHNDLIEQRAVQLHHEHRFRNVVCLSEVDILRSARIRERCQIPGHSEADAWFFRDKLMMKRRAWERGLGTPYHQHVRHAFDLLDFCKAHGFPVIVRPTTGRGSARTDVLRSHEELERYLDSAAIAATDFRPDLLVENFVDGDMFRVDGLILQGRPVVMQIGKYINSTLDFMAGKIVATISVSNDNPMKQRIERFATALLTSALPAPQTSLFHLQLLHSRDDALLLCEVAARIGGGTICDEVQLALGIDIKMEYVRYACIPEYRSEALESNTGRHGLAGRVLIPPKHGVLERMPEQCPLDYVAKYARYGIPGRRYAGPAMTNAEVASFVYRGDSEQQLIERTHAIADWFESASAWNA